MKRMNEDNGSAFDFIGLQDRLPEATMNSPRGVQLRLGTSQLPTAILNHLAMSPTPPRPELRSGPRSGFAQQVVRGNGG